MQYALLAYAPPEDTDRATRPIPDALAALLDRPNVTGWARLHAEESATTLRNDDGRVLLTDGPFIDSKEYLAGLFVIEAGNLDGALATARELLLQARPGTAIEVRKTFTEVAPPTRLAYLSLIDFVPDRESYEHLTTIDIEPADEGTNVVMTVDPLHDQTWTQQHRAHRGNELDNLEAAIRRRTT